MADRHVTEVSTPHPMSANPAAPVWTASCSCGWLLPPVRHSAAYQAATTHYYATLTHQETDHA